MIFCLWFSRSEQRKGQGRDGGKSELRVGIVRWLDKRLLSLQVRLADKVLKILSLFGEIVILHTVARRLEGMGRIIRYKTTKEDSLYLEEMMQSLQNSLGKTCTYNIQQITLTQTGGNKLTCP